MGLFDTLFGGKDDSAQKEQIAANRETAKIIQRNAEQARRDAMRLFPAAQGALQSGVQSALDLYGQSVPQQMSAFQQGNVGAQEAQLIGLGAIQKALMGMPLDLSMQQIGQYVQPVSVDTSFARQRVPGFTSADQVGVPMTVGQPQPMQDPWQQALAQMKGVRF